MSHDGSSALVSISVPPLSFAPLFPSAPAIATYTAAPYGQQHLHCLQQSGMSSLPRSAPVGPYLPQGGAWCQDAPFSQEPSSPHHQGGHGASVEQMLLSSFLAQTSQPPSSVPPSTSPGEGGDQIVWVLSNRYLRAAFDCRGRLVALFDRVWMRELVPASEGALGNRSDERGMGGEGILAGVHCGLCPPLPPSGSLPLLSPMLALPTYPPFLPGSSCSRTSPRSGTRGTSRRPTWRRPRRRGTHPLRQPRPPP